VPVAGLVAPAQAAPVGRVSGRADDSPGSAIAVVLTTSSRPSGYALRFRVSVAGIPGVCNGSQWRHSTGWRQRCWVTLPSGLGNWTVSSRAVFTRAGYATQYSAYGYKSVATKGFLPTGQWAFAKPSKVAAIRNAGHLLGNHTHWHPALDTLSSSSVRWQISHGVSATSTPKLIRPPYGAGAYSQRITNDAAALGYRVCHWTTDTSDYAGLSATTIINKVLYGDAVTAPARAGGSVLMHMSGANTPAALPGLIRGMRAKGLLLEPLR